MPLRVMQEGLLEYMLQRTHHGGTPGNLIANSVNAHRQQPNVEHDCFTQWNTLLPPRNAFPSHTLALRADSWTGLWEVGFRLDTEVVLAESVTVNNTTAVRPKFKLTATRPDLTFARGSESVR